MSNYWFADLRYNYDTKAYETRDINFNSVYKDEFIVDEIKRHSYGIWKYDLANVASLEAWADSRIPATGEDAVLRIKTTVDAEFDFSPSGQLLGYSPNRMTIFKHYESIEREYSYEIGQSMFFLDTPYVNYIDIVNGNAEWFQADKEASYIDFYYHSEGHENLTENSYKIRNTFDESDRTALASFEGVQGDFDSGWWDTVDLSGDYQFIGTNKNDVIEAFSGSNFGTDLIDGRAGNDQLVGFRGADNLIGGVGNDLLRAGNGRDLITGGPGEDIMYGGFGLNTFQNSADGDLDQLFIKSDQHAYNWIYDKAGNSPNGEKADKIEMLDEFDQIYVQGVETSQLSYGFVDHNSNLGETLSGIGIYASGVLEAVYVGDNLSQSQIAAMTQGVL